MHIVPMQSASSRRGGGSLLRQLSMQEHGAAGADADAAGLETVMWTRVLAKRLLLPRADLEGLEDLLDTYFMLVRALTASVQATKDMSSMHSADWQGTCDGACMGNTSKVL